MRCRCWLRWGWTSRGDGRMPVRFIRICILCMHYSEALLGMESKQAKEYQSPPSSFSPRAPLDPAPPKAQPSTLPTDTKAALPVLYASCLSPSLRG
jgi:hypothetical protein